MRIGCKVLEQEKKNQISYKSFRSNQLKDKTSYLLRWGGGNLGGGAVIGAQSLDFDILNLRYQLIIF